MRTVRMERSNMVLNPENYHSGEKTYNIGQYLLRLYLADLATPFRTVKNVISMRKEGPRFEYIFNFIIMMLFIIGNIIAFWKIVHI